MKYFTLMAAFFIGLNLQAQAPIGFSLTAGANQSSLVSDDLLADPGMGYKIGTVFNFGYHESYSYQIELFYNKSTIDLLTVDPDFESAGNSKYNYASADLGLYFDYYILNPEEDQFYFGPQVGVTLSFGGQLTPQKSKGPGDEYYLPHLLDEYDLTELPKFSYGAGVGFTGGYNDFRFDLRYTLGMTNLLNDVQTDSYDGNNRYTGPKLEGKLNTFSFTISYRLNKLFGYE